ncbi:MAG TPA: pyridoxal-phosphate dependent enzyme [Thermoplasmata archaeon]|nr:pyridoxal-phosphate dependent enzyme [Thermoplasmata archaeon]
MTARNTRPESVLDLVGGTPIVPLRRVARDLPYRVLAKLEYLNPGGSVKDRIGSFMIEAAEKDGRLKPGGTIVEATSGNTGVGLAMIAAVRGYRIVIVIPDKMSSEKIRMLRAFGARVVVTPSGIPPDHPMSMYSVARRLSEEIPGAFYPNQYENAGNPEAHYRTTAPEIDRDVPEGLAAVIGTVGTGGTMSGIGRYFKEHRPAVRIVAVDPQGSVLGNYFRTHEVGKAVPYLVEGIGEDMIPKSIHFQYLDDFVEVSDKESFLMARRLTQEEGLFVGGSSGSAVVGAIRWLSGRPVPEGSTVVVLLPDSGDRYLTKVYSDDWMREQGMLEIAATAGELLARKTGTPALVAVEPTTVVRDALELLRRHGISQAPILSGGRQVGRVEEDDLLRRGLTDETVLDRSVRMVPSKPLPEVSADATVAELLKTLREEKSLVVRDPTLGTVIGVLTRHDLVGYLSEEGGSHAV